MSAFRALLCGDPLTGADLRALDDATPVAVVLLVCPPGPCRDEVLAA
eukprot:gene27218-26935_t